MFKQANVPQVMIDWYLIYMDSIPTIKQAMELNKVWSNIREDTRSSEYGY